MQQPDERPRGPGRPSLFSENAPPAADSLGILSQLDGKSVDAVRARSPSSRPRPVAKMAGAFALVGLVGAACVWWAVGADGPADTPPAVAAGPVAIPVPVAAVAPPAVPPAAAAPLATAAPQAPAEENEVSAATILDGTTAALVPPAAAAERTTSLAQALEAPPAKEKTKHAKRDVKVAKAAPAKHGARDAKDAKDKRRETSGDAERKTRHAAHRPSSSRGRQAAEKDSDAALLEALLSHTRPVSDGGRTQHAAKGK